ncbi:MAG TPA: response regulator transcription factor [Candidatus Babeliaceae bacterium]|nr:response regulator transcription factor [Candidatus Babeliaceae bacterium]
MAIKVAIIDNHPLAIKGVQSMLSSSGNISVIATYNSGEALLKGLQKEQPDVLLLDIMLPDISGKDLAPEINKKYPAIRILVLTSLDAPSHIKSMMRRGCAGYLLKDTEQKTLIDAIEQVYMGAEFIEPALKEQMLQNVINFKKNTANNTPELTPREKEILQLIVQELTSQEIADKLFISLHTVESHRFSLFQKLDVKNMIGLVKVAIQMGIVK